MFSGNFPPQFSVYRTIGAAAGERFGVGVMHKTGGADYQNRAHPEYVIVLVLRGSGIYRTAEGEEFRLVPGSVFQRFRGVVHTTEIDPGCNWVEGFLELGQAAAAMLARYGFADPAEPVVQRPPAPELAERFAELGECFRTASDSELQRRIPDIIALGCACLGGPEEEKEDPRRELIAAACAFLGRDFRNPADLEEFCRRHGCGYENFRKLFRAELGISPHRYRIRRRLDAACALLNRPELSIGEIAVRLGYASQYEFSAQFKRYMGCPPSNYRH